MKEKELKSPDMRSLGLELGVEVEVRRVFVKFCLLVRICLFKGFL